MDFIADIIDWVINQLLNTGCSVEYVSFADIGDSAGTIITTMWGYIETLAIGLTVIFFLMEINRKWVFEGGDVTMKTIAAPFLKLIAAVAVISMSATIFEAIANGNDAFVNWADGAFTDVLTGELETGLGADQSIGQIVNEKVGFLQKLILVLPILLSFLISIACNLVFLYKGFLYRIEFIARLMFAPIAMADVYSGQNSNAVRYVKGTLALVLYAVCLIVLPKVTMFIAIGGFQEMIQDMVTNTDVDVLDVILNILKLCVAPIAAIGVTGAAKTLTREAVGA